MEPHGGRLLELKHPVPPPVRADLVRLMYAVATGPETATHVQTVVASVLTRLLKYVGCLEGRAGSAGTHAPSTSDEARTHGRVLPGSDPSSPTATLSSRGAHSTIPLCART